MIVVSPSGAQPISARKFTSASRQVAGGAELIDRDRAVALRELLAVGAQDVRRRARTTGSSCAERAQDLDLLRRVRDVVVAADHVRDRVVHVLDRRGEVVGRAAVGADDDEVLELLVRELDAPANRVVPAGRRPRRACGSGSRPRPRTPAPRRRAARPRVRQRSIASSWNVDRPVPVDARASAASAGSAPPPPRPRGSCRCSRSAAGTRRPVPRAKSQLKRDVRTPPMWRRPGRGTVPCGRGRSSAPGWYRGQAGLGAGTAATAGSPRRTAAARIAAHDAHITTSAIQSVSTMPIASASGPTSAHPIGIRTNDPSVS